MPRAALSDEAIEAFREQLCRAAARRFAESGYEGVTLRGLAAELGVSPMTPYRYFRDKDEIFSAVRAAGFRRFADAQEAAFDRPLDPGERLAALGRAYLDFARREPHAYRIMFELRHLEATPPEELRREQTRAWQPLVRSVAAAVEAGVLQGDPQTVAHVFWAGLHGLVSLELAGALHHGRSVDSLMEPMLAILFRGARSAAPPLEATA